MRKCLFLHSTGSEAGPVVDLGAEHLSVRKNETNPGFCVKNDRM